MSYSVCTVMDFYVHNKYIAYNGSVSLCLLKSSILYVNFITL